MKFLICLLRGHQPVPVKIVDVWMAPGYGLQTVYKSDPKGDRLACERCRRILQETT